MSKKEEKGGGLRAVGIVGGATILSRILGLVREIVFVAIFSRAATDAFSVAFTIPNLLRRLLAEGILSTAFIPVFAGLEEKEEADRLRAYGAVLGSFFAILVLITALGVLGSPWLVRLFAPGFTGTRLELAVMLTRWMFPFLLLVGLASFWVAILHTRKKFAAPALGPVFLNIGMIGCAILLYRVFPTDYAIMSLAIGVLVGGLLQLLLQIAALARLGIRIWPRWQPGHAANKEVTTLMLPTLLGLGVYQINVLISRAFASLLPEGSITYIYLSDRLMELPLGVIAVAFATVNLPTLSRQAEQGDWQTFRATLLGGVRNVLFFCIPASFILFALREPIIMALFQRNKFTMADVVQCAHVFAPATSGLIFVAALRNLSPGFYAYKDPRTPVKIAFFSLLLNAALSALFAFVLKMGAQGLTLANSCSAFASVALSLFYLHRKLEFSQRELSFIWSMVPRLLIASAIMAMGLWLGGHLLPWRSMNTLLRLIALGVLIPLGSLIYFFLVLDLEIPEANAFRKRLQTLAKRFRKRK